MSNSSTHPPLTTREGMAKGSVADLRSVHRHRKQRQQEMGYIQQQLFIGLAGWLQLVS